MCIKGELLERDFIPKSKVLSIVSMSCHRTGDSNFGGRAMVIETHKNVQYWADNKSAFRATVCKINGVPRVGIGKWWFDQHQKQWFPAKKGHVYHLPEQWRALATRVHGLTQSLAAVEKQMQNTEVANAGMHERVVCLHDRL